MISFKQRFAQVVVSQTWDNSVKGNKHWFSSINKHTDAQ